MKKSYHYNSRIYIFADVEMESGCLYGRCTTYPRKNQWAWLDNNGFQFHGERRIEATEITSRDSVHAIPNGCHYWGGEIRNNAQWRKQW